MTALREYIGAYAGADVRPRQKLERSPRRPIASAFQRAVKRARTGSTTRQRWPIDESAVTAAVPEKGYLSNASATGMLAINSASRVPPPSKDRGIRAAKVSARCLAISSSAASRSGTCFLEDIILDSAGNDACRETRTSYTGQDDVREEVEARNAWTPAWSSRCRARIRSYPFGIVRAAVGNDCWAGEPSTASERRRYQRRSCRVPRRTVHSSPG